MAQLNTRQILLERATLLKQIRKFFEQKQVIEVDTQVLDNFSVTDPYMSALQVFNPQRKPVGYLQTSPEYAMKRLLADNSGDIFQLGKMFRADESGQYHNPEFTLLEWYRIGFSLEQLIKEVYQLICQTIGKRSFQQYHYRDAFIQLLGLDPLTSSDETIKNFAKENLGDIPQDMLRDNYLSLIFSELLEPKFDPEKITFISHYPKSQASLAKVIQHDGFELGERFEVYYGGIELANGFHELTDAKEQQARFEKDNKIRKELNLPTIEIDLRLIKALEKGLPDCSGVALGFDRLLMIKLKQDHIGKVLPLVT